MAFFIAEVSSNHSSDISRCLQFVDVAADIGCDAIKFQLFRLDGLFAPEILQRSKAHRLRKEWELPIEFLPQISTHCRKRNIQFSCTPFDLKAVDELLPYVDFYKIASYELTWPSLLEACAQTKKPVILSTGMANIDECKQSVKVLQDNNCKDITLLHCVSNYPTLPEEANLACINTLREACNVPVGWSDHSVNPAVIYQAVFGQQASVIEFHLDIEGQGAEYASGHCWLPESMQKVIVAVKEGSLAIGSAVKTATKREEAERLWRADPTDGLRPFREIRASFVGDEK